MLTSRQQLAEVLPRPGASPGLLRRRYSMPETIMRKYRLAQQRSESDDSAVTTAPSRVASNASPSPPRGSCASLCEPPQRFMRRDRELMRKSALLRRLWARPSASNPCPACCYCSEKDLYDSQADFGRESQSLDGSRAELRPMSGSLTSSRHSREPQAPAGWATPKRQRLESPSNLHGSEEMLRTAMRNSYDRAEELRQDRDAKREEAVLSDSTFQSHGRGDSPYAATPSITSFNETTESTSDEAKTRKKRRQGVCYPKSPETDTAEMKSETVSVTPEGSESVTSTMLQMLSQEQTATATSGSSFASSEVSATKNSYVTEGDLSSETLHITSNTTSSDLSHKLNESTGHIELDIFEKGESSGNNDNNILPIETSYSKIESSFEILEIVVSETLNSSAFEENKELTTVNNTKSNKHEQLLIVPKNRESTAGPDFDIDEYVSNILVESLNSLTDQLESMNATINGGRKISIVEKEIKVKLQNTGVNTIVHLSPTSNNQIIFGNEELCIKDDTKSHRDENQNTMEAPSSVKSIELSNNNSRSIISVDTPSDQGKFIIQRCENGNDSLEIIGNHENINKAVLEQIQKLFQDGLETFDPQLNYPGRMVPEISHIEISNVDVFIKDNMDCNFETSDTIEINTDRNSKQTSEELDNQVERAIGKVGTGTYYKDLSGPVLVPRFSAFPNTDSMEVNTSSSDDADILGSDCTSLVDSLDDPNSPRANLLRRSFSNRRNELVRSAIDILDLLPENGNKDELHNQHREKGESFYIRIQDNECDCEKENFVVADHMPDKIKQRLYRRHRKRELRMEYAKRKKVRQLKRDIENQRISETGKSKKEIEKDCVEIINALIDEVVSKIAQEEYKYMRIKQKSSNHRKSAEDLSCAQNKKKSHKQHQKDSMYLNNMESFKINKNGAMHFCCSNVDKVRHLKDPQYELNEHMSNKNNLVHGKISLRTHPSGVTNDYGPKRIYQKSEIHDGNKCIEILEILEYADSSQTSPETTNSDENLNQKSLNNRKSKIPLPVYERITRMPKIKCIQKPHRSTGRSSPISRYDRNDKVPISRMDHIVASMLIDALNDNTLANESQVLKKPEKVLRSSSVPTRRASVPQQDTMRRPPNSNRFKQIFDIIPEEKSSLSIDSSNEDIYLNRRVSAPAVSEDAIKSQVQNSKNHATKLKSSLKIKNKPELAKANSLEMKNAATSPFGDWNNDSSQSPKKIQTKNVTTSPLRKTASAATSPMSISLNGDIKNYDKTIGSLPNDTKKLHSSQDTHTGWARPGKQVQDVEGISISYAPYR